MKAAHVSGVKKFQDIPNVGPAMAADFILLGLKTPDELVGADAFKLYRKLCAKTKSRHDPCVLDTFIAVVDFMNGAPRRDWWYYTKQRKKQYPDI